MSASAGSGGCGKRTMADVLMGNARDAVRKATTALSPKRLKTQPGAQVDGAVAKPEAEGKPPLPVKSKRAPSLKKLKTQPGAQADGPVAKPEAEGKPPSPVKSKRSSSPTKSKSLGDAGARRWEEVPVPDEELGDLGLVAKASRLSQKMMYKPKPLAMSHVLATFQIIAKESGKDSQDKKRSHIKGLLIAATDCEPQYIIRLLQLKIRLGLVDPLPLRPPLEIPVPLRSLLSL